MSTPEDTEPPVAEFWRRVELSSLGDEPGSAAAPLFAGGPPWLESLARAERAELALRTEGARAELARLPAGTPQGPYGLVRRLIELRVELRSAVGPALLALPDELDALLASLPESERSTRARALHTRGVLALRLGRWDEAETSLGLSLAASEEGPLRTWILDGMGQVFLGLGAWQEARRTLGAVARRKEQAGDRLGVAISQGHLALLELRLGQPQAAAAAARAGLERGDLALGALSRLRLQTLLLTAWLEAGARDEAALGARALEALFAAAPPGPHHLRGFAALALARSEASRGDLEGVRRWLRLAEPELALPEQTALLGYWEARLLPSRSDGAGFWPRMEALFQRAGQVTEAEVLTHLLLAERAAAGKDYGVMRERLRDAYRTATHANNPLWLERVDRSCRELDPPSMTERVIERFSGRSARELEQTRLESATIVFADLVGFTPRSLVLSPEEVMQTVRSLFELAVPLLTRHKVRPVSCLGDGLLAVCQGEGHEGRGLSFALDLVRRASRVTSVRRALGDAWGLDLRAGVASGPVVMGVLGTLFKLEFSVIGPPTNLAARLQAQALPGEVVCSLETARAAGRDGPAHESLSLKGYDAPVEALRLPAPELGG